MSFADTGNRSSTTNTKKTEFFELSQGQHLIRILDSEATRIDTHWVNNASIRCLGGECPICKDNFTILRENPKNYRDIKGWNPARKTFFVNVFDKTLVKTCPVCGVDTKKNVNLYPSACPKCNAVITTTPEHPLNKIKLLSRGVQLFDFLNSMVTSILDEAGNIREVTSYDIILTVSGLDKERKVFPMPLPNNSEPVTIEEGSLFDPNKAVLTLNPAEIKELQRGVRVKDILLARKVESTDSELEEISEDTKKAVEDSIAKLFPNG